MSRGKKWRDRDKKALRKKAKKAKPQPRPELAD